MSELVTAAELGSALRARRVRRGMTQQEVADRAHVSRPWLIKLERGHPNAELGKVLAVVQALRQVVNLTDRPEALSDIDLDQVLDLTT